MIDWIVGNIGTVIVCLILLLIVAVIVASLVKNKKKGRSSYGANCAHCAMAGSCHKK